VASRSRRAARQLLHPSRQWLGTADTHGIPSPFSARLDRQRHTTDGHLFQGTRGGPLSESLYGRIWHRARAAAIPEDKAGTQPVRRPYDLRHAALSLWLASGAPPAEVAARAGHSVRVLLTTYAHTIPGLRPTRHRV
jgi:integrase